METENLFCSAISLPILFFNFSDTPDDKLINLLSGTSNY